MGDLQRHTIFGFSRSQAELSKFQKAWNPGERPPLPSRRRNLREERDSHHRDAGGLKPAAVAIENSSFHREQTHEPAQAHFFP
jgi:hypothetical protein